MKDVSYGYLMKVLLTLPFTLRIQSERCLLRVSDEGSADTKVKDVSYGYLMKVLLTLPFTLRMQSERCLLRVSDEGSADTK